MEAKKPKVEIKAVNVEDLGIMLADLPSGTYLIDGEIVSQSGYNLKRVQVKDVNNIRIVTQTKFLSHYEDADGNRLTRDEFNDSVKELTKNAICNEGYYFAQEFIDDEYVFKKFKIKWNAIYKTVQELSDPILVEVAVTKYKTGNPFVQPMFFTGESDDLKLFSYNQPSARLKIVEEYMTKLGFTFAGDKNNYDITKEWCNSTHSVIKYVKAFGGYVFDGWDSKYIPKGTMSDMIDTYNKDKKAIEKIIYDKYIAKFGNIDKGKFDFNLLLVNLKSCERYISNIDYKVKSADDYRKAKGSIREIIENLQNKMEVK